MDMIMIWNVRNAVQTLGFGSNPSASPSPSSLP